MALFEWKPEYDLDISQLDDQHKELVRMINELYDSLQGGDSADVIERTLNQLLNYVDIHFETEENAMRERRYPGLDEHIHLHQELRSRVLDLRKEQLQGREIATFELLNFLADWLKSHIATFDAAFGRHVQNLDRRGLG